MRSLREVVLIVFGIMGILALARQALEPDALEAVAIPTAQRDVEVGLVSTNSTSFVLVPNSSVTVDNGSSARKVVVTFSAEAAVASGNLMFLGYSLDGAGCFEQAGPTVFALGHGEFATSTAVHVIPLGSGVHTIRACFKSANPSLVASLRVRVLIAEGRTK
jgi:hypothetical protein